MILETHRDSIICRPIKTACVSLRHGAWQWSCCAAAGSSTACHPAPSGGGAACSTCCLQAAAVPPACLLPQAATVLPATGKQPEASRKKQRVWYIWHVWMLLRCFCIDCSCCLQHMLHAFVCSFNTCFMFLYDYFYDFAWFYISLNNVACVSACFFYMSLMSFAWFCILSVCFGTVLYMRVCVSSMFSNVFTFYFALFMCFCMLLCISFYTFMNFCVFFLILSLFFLLSQNPLKFCPAGLYCIFGDPQVFLGIVVCVSRVSRLGITSI